MTTLIIEAGSSKTDTVLLSGEQKVSTPIHDMGVNPVTDPSYESALTANLAHYKDVSIDFVRYYGAGCINQEVNNKVRSVIASAVGGGVDIEVQDDLLAVGRGLCQRSPGIAVILGTGSNTGYYDGSSIVDGYKSCGYLLGDEGSGYRLGQEVIARYARHLISEEDAGTIEQLTQVKSEDVIPYIYESDNPRTLIASYAAYLKSCSEELRQVICGKVFGEFGEEILRPLSDTYQCPVYISGSIAYHYKEEVLESLKRSDIHVTLLAQSPLKGLIRFHSDE